MKMFWLGIVVGSMAVLIYGSILYEQERRAREDSAIRDREDC